MVSTPTSSIPGATGGFKHVVLVVDAYSSFLSYVPIKSMKNPNRFISTIITNYQNAGYPIKHLKMDNQYNKLEIFEYLNSLQITYQFSPPYEHEFIGRIERNNRTAQDKLSCALAISSTKNKTLWLYALSDAVAKLNLLPRHHLDWQTPYFQWFKKPYDFKNNPLLPFGCRVMSHNHVDNQTKLSPNGTLHYYVGPAPFTKQGILLYNPKTKLVSIRRSFQQLNRNDPTIPELPLQVLEDDPALFPTVSTPMSHQSIFQLPTQQVQDTENKNLAALPAYPIVQNDNINGIPTTAPTSPTPITNNHNSSPITTTLLSNVQISPPSSSAVTEHHPTLARQPSITNTGIPRRNNPRPRNLPNRFAALAETNDANSSTSTIPMPSPTFHSEFPSPSQYPPDILASVNIYTTIDSTSPAKVSTKQ